MKAAVYYHRGGPEVLRYQDVPDPAVPVDGVLVRVQAISIEGGDTLHRARDAVTATPPTSWATSAPAPYLPSASRSSGCGWVSGW
jgi:NADPH:quinone reductase-like Zn-dependent oxidoreductase